MPSVHRYEASCAWRGSTGLGYEHYIRSHEARAVAPTPAITLSADASFGGDPRHMNPEQLVVLAASSCQLLSFLAVAARARVDVVAYEDQAVGLMPEEDLPVRLTRIELHPTITIAGEASDERVRHLVEVAHRECYIANSLLTEVTVDPKVFRDRRRPRPEP